MAKSTTSKGAERAPTDESVQNQPSGSDSSEKATQSGSDSSTETKSEEKPKGPLMLQPKDWAKKLGKVGKKPGLSINKQERPAPFSWDHAAADQLHGWTEHNQHTVDPLVLLQEDYQKALVAASNPDKKGKYAAHAPARSPFKRGKR